jgi:hypothetical protein
MGKTIRAAIYLAGTTLLIYSFFPHWSYDDPFITYRYAANLQHGLGFVYNPGERALSTTTPLFTLLLALLGNLWTDLPHLANLLGAFSLAWGGLFLWDLARTWQAPLVGWSGLWLYPTFPLLVSTLGSETPLYLAFCLGTFAFYARQRYPLAAVFAALAILTRPDGILVAFILAAHYLLQIRRPIPWRAAGLFLALTLPWFVFSWVYFGSPLPATLAVKQHQGAMAISQRFAPGLLTILRGYARWPYILEAGLAIAGVAFMFRRARRWALFLAWTMLYFLAYSALGVSRYFWYYAPLVPGLIVLIGLGISSIRNSSLPKPLFSRNSSKSNSPPPNSPFLGNSSKNNTPPPNSPFSGISSKSNSPSPNSPFLGNSSKNNTPPPNSPFLGNSSINNSPPPNSPFLGNSSINNSPPPNSPFLGIWGRPGGGRIATLALLLLLISAQAYDLGQLRQHPDNRLEIYPVVGEWLRDHTPPQASVGTLEVGMIGYYSQRRMIDFAGLIQAQVSNQLTTHATYEDAALWAVERYHPDYLVLHENLFPRLEQGYAAQRCTVIKHFSGKAYGYSADLNIYACR